LQTEAAWSSTASATAAAAAESLKVAPSALD